ncbi:MAG: cupin domain-containing protein [Candidatus Dormibacteraeota bacterium]|nr:cupin domain-containing protein [Candidatus Dormibacteraeota bacterium]
MTTYTTHLDMKFAPLERIDVQALVDACTDKWYNQTLCAVNESVVRLGVLEGEYHWHTHEEEDEFFFVVDGGLLMDLDSGTVELGTQQAITVPKGVRHRPRAPRRTVVLMMERCSVVPTGDAPAGERSQAL